MLNLFGDSLCIGVSKTGIALLQAGGRRRSNVAVLTDSPMPAPVNASFDQHALLLRDALTENPRPGLSTTIVLADEWIRFFMVTPPKNTVRMEDCRAAASMRFQALYGDNFMDWHIEADWNVQHSFLACAIPNTLLKALQEIATQYRLPLVATVPHFASMWNRWRARLNTHAWFGVVHENVLTIGIIDQRRLCAIRATSIPSDAWNDLLWLPEHLSREALRMNIPAPGQFHLCGQLPEAGSMQSIGELTVIRLDASRTKVIGASTSSAVSLARAGLCL
jgi:hypothetical protein